MVHIKLGFGMDHELSIDLILVGIPDIFALFVLNYRMNEKKNTIPKLINLLKIIEPNLKKKGEGVMLMDYSGSNNKKKRKSIKA